MANVSLVKAMSNAVTKALPGSPNRTLAPVNSGMSGGWWPVIQEPFTGAWQRNMELRVADVVTNYAVWACATLIARDIAKLGIDLVKQNPDDIWTPTENSAFSPVLRKPNRYSTRIKFIEHWILSKRLRGNTYALKQRNNRGGIENGNVEALYILDPTRVTPLVASDGSVFYKLYSDNLTGIDNEGLVVPASEMIHDINVPLYHPLIGVGDIHACGLAAIQGLKIQNNSEQFFANMSQPGGVLTAPGMISDTVAQRLKDHWESNFTGVNAGRVAVLGDGLKYEPMTVNAHDAQLIEQLKWSGDAICACFHVPGWKVGLAPMPAYGNVQAANIEYYSQALQNDIESLELCLDEGLELPSDLGIQCDTDALLRMDSATQMDLVVKGVGGGLLKPNEGRATLNYLPVKGGNSPMMQQQQFSLEALAERDADKPFAKPAPAAPAAPAVTQGGTMSEEKAFDESVAVAMLNTKAVALGLVA